jgi:hypothetical protein
LSDVKEFNVSEELELPDDVDVPPGAKVTVALVGGFVPIVRVLLRLTSSMVTSIKTSDFGLSMSASSFWASTIWSGVPRNVSDLCSGVTWMRLMSRIPLSVPAACCKSLAVETLRR